MSRIPDAIVEQIRDTADLLEVVQDQVQLKRTGSDWRGPCPFHQGTGRNFAVIPRKNLYYCFVCHASGDVFTWYRKRFGLDYPSAVREVARRYGITIPEAASPTGPDPREPLFQACEVAQQWYATALRESAIAAPARRYLVQREISLDQAATLGLGFAADAGFLDAMHRLGISDDLLVDAALGVRRGDGTIAPRFRRRLLFPIHDLRGRVVAFGGRLLGAGEPKYLNSGESPIFHKGEQLYHLHLARPAIRKAECAILVEGYFDVQRLALLGLDHVVAPLGTSCTDAQAALIKRYTTDVVVCYDSDAAGLKAAFRAADILLAQGVRVRIATLPSGQDPDSLGQRGGADAVRGVIDDAIDVLERKLQLLDRGGWFGDVRRAREALDRLLPTLRAASDPVTRELYLSRVADRLGVPRDVVVTEVARAPIAGVPVAARTQRETPPRSRDRRLPSTDIERGLLRVLLWYPDWLERARREVQPDQFAVPACRAIFDAALAVPEGTPLGAALETLDRRAHEVWMQLVDDGPPDDKFAVDQAYADALAALDEMRTFPDIAAERNPAIRRQRWSALTREGQERFRFYLATASRNATPARSSPPSKD